MRICFTLLFVFFSFIAVAKINSSKKDIELSVTTQINKQAVGMVTLVVDPKDQLFLKWPEFSSSLQSLLYESEFSEIEKLRGQTELISLKSLKMAGISVDFSMLDFSLDIVVPLTKMRPRHISLIAEPSRLQVVQPTELSGYINMYSSYINQINKPQNKSQKQLTIRPETVLNWQGWVVENEFQYQSNVDQNNVKRVASRLIHDLPKRGMRLSIGDNYSSGSYFQSTTGLLGVSLVHDVSLTSGRPIKPSASQSFTLDSPSSVEVIVDDRLVQRLNLSAGTYSLNDIPLNEGSNNITLRITDSAGVSRLINFSVTTGLHLFAEDELEFEVHLGFPAVMKKQLTYFNNPLLSANFDYGLTPSWTFGASVQGDKNTQQIGSKQIFATPIGQFSFENSLNLKAPRGYAYRAVFNSLSANYSQGVNMSVGYEYTSKNYQKINFHQQHILNSVPREHFIQADLSIPNEESVNTSFYLTFSRSYGQPKFDKSVGVVFSGNLINPNWHFSIAGQWEDIKQQQWGLRAALTYRFSNSRQLKLSHQTKRQFSRLEFTQSSNQHYVGAVNIRSGIENNDSNEAIYDFNSHYNANRFLLTFDHGSYYQSLDANSARHQSRVSAATSIAFAGNNWSFGKPIADSFALIKPHKSLRDKTITLGLEKPNYRATNADFDTILFSDISAYNNMTLNLDVDDLPTGYDLGAGTISFKPSYRSGHAVIVGSDANISIIATLKNAHGEPLASQVGNAICTDEFPEQAHTFFTSKTGRFALTGLKPCLYKLQFKGLANDTITIDVHDDEQLQRKGVIYVH